MYGNSVKAQWRSGLWDWLAGEVEDIGGWCICLAGNRFLDRKAAARAGFSKSKIIGVDTDAGVVAHNNAHGRTVVRLPLSTALAVWPVNRNLSVVLADYTCTGQSEEIAVLIKNWRCSPATSDALLVINVAVGHEKGGFRKFLQLIADYQGWEMRRIHRAYASVWYWCFCHRAQLAEHKDTALTDALEDVRRLTVDWTSYKARRIRMDGIVLRPSEQWKLEGYDAWVMTEEFLPYQKHLTAKLAWHSRREN